MDKHPPIPTLDCSCLPFPLTLACYLKSLETYTAHHELAPGQQDPESRSLKLPDLPTTLRRLHVPEVCLCASERWVPGISLKGHPARLANSKPEASYGQGLWEPANSVSGGGKTKNMMSPGSSMDYDYDIQIDCEGSPDDGAALWE